jgi:hypothetical protein
MIDLPKQKQKNNHLGRRGSGATDADVERILQVTLRVRTHIQTYRKLYNGEAMVFTSSERKTYSR